MPLNQEEVIKLPFTITGAQSKPIRGDVLLSAGTGRDPVVVICHGFKGFKDWGFFPYLGRSLAARGYYTVLFNYSHNGIGEQPEIQSELDLFKENCFAFEREDLQAVLAALRNKRLPEPNRADFERIALVGHSRGGAAAVSGGTSVGVKAVGLLAAISDYPAVNDEEAAEWERDGVHYVENARTKQQLPLGTGLLHELVHDQGTIERHVMELRVPLCIIHGTEDKTVAPSAAQSLASWARDAEVHMLESDHTLGSQHPFGKPSPALENAIEIYDSFFTRCLSGGAA